MAQLYEKNLPGLGFTSIGFNKYIDEMSVDYLDLPRLTISNSNLIELPDSILNFKNLRYLCVGGNKLTSLPDSIGELKVLKRLDLDNNNFSDYHKHVYTFGGKDYYYIDGYRLSKEDWEKKRLLYLNAENF